jgi:transposase
MYGLEIYYRVRRAVRIDGMSERVAAIAFGIGRGTVSKMLEFSEPPGYQLRATRLRSRMDKHAAFVDQILIDDQDKPKKQRHTVQRIF